MSGSTTELHCAAWHIQCHCCLTSHACIHLNIINTGSCSHELELTGITQLSNWHYGSAHHRLGRVTVVSYAAGCASSAESSGTVEPTGVHTTPPPTEKKQVGLQAVQRRGPRDRVAQSSIPARIVVATEWM